MLSLSLSSNRDCPLEAICEIALQVSKKMEMEIDSKMNFSKNAEENGSAGVDSPDCSYEFNSYDVAKQCRQSMDGILDEMAQNPGSVSDFIDGIGGEDSNGCSDWSGKVYHTSQSAVKNGRKTMEDRHVIIPDLNKIMDLKTSKKYSYYAVFDGHAGVDAASYSSAHLHRYLVESEAFAEGRIEDAIHEAFQKTDSSYCDRIKFDGIDYHRGAGTTAVIALIEDQKTVYLAWVGDSQAVLVKNGVHHEVMLPHKPGDEQEKERIAKAGGFVAYVDTWRVNGILSVSRAIGDPEYKPSICAEPGFVKFDIEPSLDFLVIGCDGLFDVLTGPEIASHVFEFLCQNENDDSDDVIDRVSTYLSKCAVNEGSSDNITSIVLFFKPLEQLVSSGLNANHDQDSNSKDSAGVDSSDCHFEEISSTPPLASVELETPTVGDTATPSLPLDDTISVNPFEMENIEQVSSNAPILNISDNPFEMENVEQISSNAPILNISPVVDEFNPDDVAKLCPESKDGILDEMTQNVNSQDSHSKESAPSDSSVCPSEEISSSPPLASAELSSPIVDDTATPSSPLANKISDNPFEMENIEQLSSNVPILNISPIVDEFNPCDVAKQYPESTAEILDEITQNTDRVSDFTDVIGSVESNGHSDWSDKEYHNTKSAVKNGHKTMKDRHVIIPDLNKFMDLKTPKKYSYYAAFDGRADVDAISYNSAHLHQYLVESDAFADGRIEDAIREAFQKTDSSYCDRVKFDGGDSHRGAGTTAVIALIEDQKTVYLAWVGDSQAVLVKNGVHHEVKLPHTPGDEQEKERIAKAGGFIAYVDTLSVNGILSSSCAIGDTEFKPNISSEPGFVKFDIEPSLDFLVIGCDGLFDVLTGSEIASHVFEFLCQNENDDSDDIIDRVSTYLSKCAVNEGSSDNITSIVLFFKSIEQLVSSGLNANHDQDSNSKDSAGVDSSDCHFEEISSTPPLAFAELSTPTVGDTATPSSLLANTISVNPFEIENIEQVSPNAPILNVSDNPFEMENIEQISSNAPILNISPVVDEFNPCDVAKQYPESTAEILDEKTQNTDRVSDFTEFNPCDVAEQYPEPATEILDEMTQNVNSQDSHSKQFAPSDSSVCPSEEISSTPPLASVELSTPTVNDTATPSAPLANTISDNAFELENVEQTSSNAPILNISPIVDEFNPDDVAKLCPESKDGILDEMTQKLQVSHSNESAASDSSVFPSESTSAIPSKPSAARSTTPRTGTTTTSSRLTSTSATKSPLTTTTRKPTVPTSRTGTTTSASRPTTRTAMAPATSTARSTTARTGTTTTSARLANNIATRPAPATATTRSSALTSRTGTTTSVSRPAPRTGTTPATSVARSTTARTGTTATSSRLANTIAPKPAPVTTTTRPNAPASRTGTTTSASRSTTRTTTALTTSAARSTTTRTGTTTTSSRLTSTTTARSTPTTTKPAPTTTTRRPAVPTSRTGPTTSASRLTTTSASRLTTTSASRLTTKTTTAPTTSVSRSTTTRTGTTTTSSRLANTSSPRSALATTTTRPNAPASRTGSTTSASRLTTRPATSSTTASRPTAARTATTTSSSRGPSGSIVPKAVPKPVPKPKEAPVTPSADTIDRISKEAPVTPSADTIDVVSIETPVTPSADATDSASNQALASPSVDQAGSASDQAPSTPPADLASENILVAPESECPGEDNV